MGIKDIELKDGNKLPIRQFKLENMVENPAIVMIAKRGSGKSWVVRAILHHFRSVPCGIVIAPTDRMNSFYNDFFPDSYIHYEYKSDIMTKLLQRQIMMIEKKKQRQKMGKKLDARTYCIMDDCLSSKGSWMRDQPIQELLYNGRHYEIMYILTMQYPLGITPELRSNFDYIFLLKEEYNPTILEFLNILEGNLRLIKATNRGDQSRLDTAKNIIREVKSRTKKLEDKVQVLEERLKILEEQNMSKRE